MPIDRDALAAIGRTYVAQMTSIRGRRVHRLIMRELARFDHVVPAVAEDGGATLFALGANGAAAVCRTDGRGPSAPMVELRLEGATVTTAYDLLKDSLPILSWTIWHPSLDRVAGGALTIHATTLADADRARFAEAVRGFRNA
jgi:hypothetical protein